MDGRKTIALLAALAVLALAAAVWRTLDLPDESAGQTAAIDAERAAIERTLERTLRESRTGVEEPGSEAPPSVDESRPANAARQDVAPPEAASGESGIDPNALPDGYTLGTFRGAMQRAPRTTLADPEPAPNPAWLDGGAAQDAILDQATTSERPFTFAVLRVSPGTDLQALNRSLAALDAQLEGSTGPYVRVRVPAERGPLEAIAALDGVLGVGAIPPELKADEAFVQDMLSRPASEQVPVYITLMAADPAGDWRQALTGLGATVGAYDSDLRSYTANLAPAALGQVVAADFVMYVEPIPIVTTNHSSSVPVMGADAFRTYDPATERFTGITGSGIAVGVLDTGLNTSHIDIAHGRASICGASLVSGEDWDLWLDLGGHGTHVFGTIGGAGRTDPVLAGIAPGLSHLRVGKVLTAAGKGTADNTRRGMDYLAHPTSCFWQGARSAEAKPLIVNMSLAATALTFSGRGVGERKLDSVVNGHSQLYVVAQANSAQHGFSNYGTAKNSLAVGAVEDTGIIAWFSSHGPTADGRLATNVVGTGVSLTSARGRASLSGHDTFSGTSMAAPSVAGVAALLMEARPEFQNRPALTRARLMASAIRPHAYLESRTQLPADNTDGPGAFNNLYGLGLVSARASLFSRDDPEGWLIGSATSEPDNDSYEYIDIEVPAGAGRLDIVLTWDEQPADTLTRSVLNDLDLWADQGADCGEDACGEHASRSGVDNVEWLLIEDPVPGTYRIKVVPVEIYGESSTAAVAWKILRGDPVPELHVEVEDTSSGATSEFITVDVTVDANRYLAAGTTLHLGCRNVNVCDLLSWAYEAHRRRVYRADGLHWSDPRSTTRSPSWPIPLGEVAAGAPKKVQLRFRREHVRQVEVLHVTASSWSAGSALGSLTIGMDATDATDPENELSAPTNDDFSTSKHIVGDTGETLLDLILASREPGETIASASTKTVWYTWEAPRNGLFRFRLQKAHSGDAVDASFELFTGNSIVELDQVAEKRGNEISFASQADTVYRLRIAYSEFHLAPVTLTWEPADLRPAHDDLAFARVIEGESGSIESTNEGATLESAEFPGGAAATVWFEWTAPKSEWWRFQTSRLTVNVFVGSRFGELRLVSQPGLPGGALFRAEQGETYRIVVGSRSADDSGARFTLLWNSLRPDSRSTGANDLFQDATEIEGAEGGVDQLFVRNNNHSISYTVEHGEPVATGTGTGWWQWTAPTDGRFTWRMDGNSGNRLTFFTGGALDDLQLVGSLQGGSTFILDATGDARYWIAAGRSLDHIGRQSIPPGTFTWGPTPVNDDRAGASHIAGVAGSAHAVLAYSTRASNDPADTVGTDSVWWRWRAPASGWQRFWLEGHPLSTIVSVYPNTASVQALTHSERTLFANGRVEIHVLARAGQTYDIRLSSRAGVDPATSTTLRWEASEAPTALSYKGAVMIDSLAANPVAQGLRAPNNLAMSDDGNYLFGSSAGGVFAFLRDPETGDLALAYRAPAWPEQYQERSDRLNRALLWWNAHNDRLLAHPVGPSYSFAVPDDGSRLLTRSEISVGFDGFIFVGDAYPGVGSSDGRFFYAVNRSEELLQAFRVDSPTRLSRVQTLSSQPVSGDRAPIVSDLGRAVDMTLSADGRYLYLATDNELLVFSRDTSSGMLRLARTLSQASGTNGPFRDVGNLTRLSLDGTGNILFLSGTHPSSARLAIAAFDIASDPSNPAHLDTLTEMYVESDLDALLSRSHDRVTLGSFYRCNSLVPHVGRAAVNAFCHVGYVVVAWNQAAGALEVTDYGRIRANDRFGNALPSHLGGGWLDRRQMAVSPDGAHVYRTTRAQNGEFIDAIHIFERASAITPPEEAVDPGDGVTDPADEVDDMPDPGGNVADPIDDGDDTDDVDDPPPPAMAGDCHPGLLVQPGESCTYPGTDDEFTVNERGRGSFLGRLAGIRIRINNETIDGRVYDFLASHQGDGVWRIDRVAGET